MIAQGQIARQTVGDRNASPVFEDELSAVGPGDRRPGADHADRARGVDLAGRRGKLQCRDDLLRRVRGDFRQRYSASADGAAMSIESRSEWVALALPRRVALALPVFSGIGVPLLARPAVLSSVS